MGYQGRRERKAVLEIPVLKVLLVSLVSKENLVFLARRERSELRGRRVQAASQGVTGETDKRVKLDASVLLAAKETQATEVLMVILETSVNVVFLELTERREILVALVEPAHLD